MTKEVERVEYALKEAENKNVALVSNGDATIYGLASLAYELNEKNLHNVTIKVLSGLTSASVCSSILGAPLNHDFAVEIISNYSEDRNIDYIIGIVKNAGRNDFEYKITTINNLVNNLDEFMQYIDMSTTLVVGNSNTKIIDGMMITPRGYMSKYE